MAWTDIDFNLLIPGMITRGPASVSFADYMQEFKTALDERLYCKEGTLSGIDDFVVGEIRNSGEWLSKFHALIEGYKTLWYGETWYTEGIMTDPTDPSSYEITDLDLETELGAEAWEILNDHATMPLMDIFKASIFNGFYTIYQKTFIYQSYDVTPSITAGNATTKPKMVSNQSTQWSIPSGTDTSDPLDSYLTAYSDWKNSFGGGWVGPTTITQSTIRTRFTSFRANYNSSDEWKIGSIGTNYIDGNNLLIKQTKLDDTIVQSRLATTCDVFRNLITDKDDTDPLEYSSFNNVFDDTELGSFNDQWTPQEVVLDANGTNHYYHYWGSRGATKPTHQNPKYASSGDPSGNTQDYDIIMRNSGDISYFYIDLNLNGLDYYITP